MTRKTFETGQSARNRSIVPVLGIAIVAVCLLSGFAAAADTLNTMNIPAPAAIGTGQLVGIADIGNDWSGEPGAGCGEHTIRCYDENLNVLGEIDNAPCYYRLTSCEDNKRTDFYRCLDRYPATAYMQRLTACTY